MKISEWHNKISWNEFVAGNSQPASFLHSWEWGEFQKTQGNEVSRIGFQPSGTRDYEKGNLIAGTSLIKRFLPIPRTYFWYVPRGPVIRTDNLGSQQVIIERLLEYMREDRQVFIRIIPSWLKGQNKTHWSELGFTEPSVLVTQREPEHTLLTALVDEEIQLKNMHHKTRYNIRLAAKKGVTVRLYEKNEDIDTFWKLLNTTASREKIRVYRQEYYRQLMAFAPPVKDAESISHAELRSIMIIAEYNSKPLACGLWLGFGSTLTYLHGGSSRDHKEVMAPYGMHWEAMKWAKRHGYKFYDWWGIEKKESVFHLGGVSRFKRGFGGQEISFAGTYDYICSRSKFSYLAMLKKMREIF